VIDLDGLRIVSNPTFDDAGPSGYLAKLSNAKATEADLGATDVVPVSKNQYPDNLDVRGREFAPAAPLVLTTAASAPRLGPHAVPLPSLEQPHDPKALTGHGVVLVQPVPTVHGPEDAKRDPDGNVNCEAIGFVLSGEGLPTVYVSGDNASIRTVTEIAHRIPNIDAVILHAGAARAPTKFAGRPLSLDSRRAAAAAAVLAAPSSSPPTTTAGPTSPKAAPRSNQPSTKPAQATSYAPPTTAPG
jgi:hypothetical protein